MRAISSTTIGYFYTAGQFLLPGLAYAIPQWRWLQLTVSVPYFVFSLLTWYVTLSSPSQCHRTTQGQPILPIPSPGLSREMRGSC